MKVEYQPGRTNNSDESNDDKTGSLVDCNEDFIIAEFCGDFQGADAWPFVVVESVNAHDKLQADRKALLDALTFITSNRGCTSINYKGHEIPWNPETISVLANAAIEAAEEED